MRVEALGLPDTWLCTPRVHADNRGLFLEWFRGDLLAAETGHQFEVVQANHSVSRRGVVRGVHFAAVPPGQAKYVYCAAGAILDVVVDVRVGSPSFGESCSVVLDAVSRQGVFIAEGLGHAFCALTEDASVVYLTSTPYDAAVEGTVSPVDPALAISWPTDVGELALSEKDADAQTLQAALDTGALPSYDECVARYQKLRHG